MENNNTKPTPTTQDELVRKFIELDKKKAEVKLFYEEFDATVKEMVETYGLDAHFQDEEGTVYLIGTCEWKAIKMTPFEIKRTKREDESKGSLSMVKARELGYQT